MPHDLMEMRPEQRAAIYAMISVKVEAEKKGQKKRGKKR